MNYIQNLNVNPSTIKIGDNVIFTLRDGSTYSGVVSKHSERGGYYVDMKEGFNSKVFSELGLFASDFVRDLVGYSPKGSWPETHTLEELGRVLEALLKVNKPVIEEPVIEEPKKPSSPSEWDWLLG